MQQLQQNTGYSRQFVIEGAPKRKGKFKKKLNLSTKRYSRRRFFKMRMKQLKAMKAAAAEAAASGVTIIDPSGIAENTTPSSAFNEQQCKIEDESISISEDFDVFEEMEIKKWDVEADGDKKELCLLPEELSQGLSEGTNYFGEAETQRLTIDSSPQAEELICEQVKTLTDVEEEDSTKFGDSLDTLSIVDMQHVFNQIKAAGNHSSALDCSTKHLRIVGMRRAGLQSTLLLKCMMCHYRCNIRSHSADDTRLNINRCAVAGTLATGGGYAQMQEFLAALNVSCMSSKMSREYSDSLVDALINAAEIEMVVAAEEEKRLAIERGDVLPSGIPHTTVIADGSWMKRSYGTDKYDSPSGIGVIIGLYSKKVLFIDVRNKNCSLCQPSTKMESDVILQGFTTSVAKRGLVYSTLIADDNSSMYKRILECNPYKDQMVRVNKIDCRNHLLRNFCKKMREVVKKTPAGRYRKTVASSVCKMRTAIMCAAKFQAQQNLQSSQQIENLNVDIMNLPSHVFGEHRRCREIGYFCDGAAKKGEHNFVPELFELGVYQRIQEVLQSLLGYAQSLLHNKTTNLVESFNSVVVKYTGAKRLNFSQRESYWTRCCAAVIQFNTKQLLSRLNSIMSKEPPSVVLKPGNKQIGKQKQNAEQPDMEEFPVELEIVETIEIDGTSYQQTIESELHSSTSQCDILTEFVDVGNDYIIQ